MPENKEHWVCDNCLPEHYEQYCVGLIGARECEICHKVLPQPPLAYVTYETYIVALTRRQKKNYE